MIHPSINNRNTITKIKEFLGWNHEEYPISAASQNDITPTRPPRRKPSSRNSVAPSDNCDIKIITPQAQMHVNDIENIDDDQKLKNGENHI